MAVYFNYTLADVVIYAYFIGLALTLGVGTAAAALALFQKLRKRSDKNEKVVD